jgi:hemerythrin-like domain-containing protein
VNPALDTRPERALKAPAALPPRSEEANRPAAPPLPGMDQLDRTHREMLETLVRLRTLLERIEREGVDSEARRLAAEVHTFFDTHAREHHAHEEAVVFPPLLAAADTELAHQVRRLQHDHGWLEEDWRLIGPQLEAIAQGYLWYDLPMLMIALPVFARLYEDHIAVEESLVYPAAKARAAALVDGIEKRTHG